ncbi:hypothetical protein C4K02_5064 [Pseudomonas synxantha]|nr:hypothetical protein C4K02_5064 [Pseudomonas synxantha]
MINCPIWSDIQRLAFQMAFQTKNKTDIFLNKQQVIFSVQITPA